MGDFVLPRFGGVFLLNCIRGYLTLGSSTTDSALDRLRRFNALLGEPGLSPVLCGFLFLRWTDGSSQDDVAGVQFGRAGGCRFVGESR